MRQKVWVAVSFLTAVVSGCTWVKSEPGAYDVDLKTANDVLNCEKLGSASTRTKDSFGFDRNADKVAIELLTLARNEAVGQGGNAVVPTSKIVEGRQTFAIYKCP
ncbi:DUF4156 domain-containing protein [Pseudomaricurvus sp.]|uniref:DUF4156 domain-containing protein n=1 Tax=Pseudomaricurvus sp. TaxID=2004510 RepID=UPI003F6B45D3